MHFLVRLIAFVVIVLTFAACLESEKRIIGGKKHLPPHVGDYYVRVVNIAGQWNEYDELCGGVIIDFSWVLTHYWCVGTGSQTHLLLGNYSFDPSERNPKLEVVVDRKDTFFSENDPEAEDGIALLKLPIILPTKKWIKRPCGYKTHHKDHKLGIVGAGAWKEGSVVMSSFIKSMKVYDDGCNGKLICCHSHDGSSLARGDRGDPILDISDRGHDHHSHRQDNETYKHHGPCGGRGPKCPGHRHQKHCVVGVVKKWDDEGNVEAARLSQHMRWIKDTIANN